MNAFSWGLYGLFIAQDFYVYAPNVLGLSLATFQLLLYCVLPAQASSSTIDDKFVTLPNHLNDSYSKVPLREVEMGEKQLINTKVVPSYQ